jgi:hypothetical protein
VGGSRRDVVENLNFDYSFLLATVMNRDKAWITSRGSNWLLSQISIQRSVPELILQNRVHTFIIFIILFIILVYSY